MKQIVCVAVLLCISLNGQNLSDQFNEYGKLYYYHLKTAPFPHPERADGHHYSGKFYSADGHYRNDLVAVFIPADYRQKSRVDMVIHFHGWYNCVDSVLTTFRLIEQFTSAQKNAILVVPQGPYKAPDSFGGKLEDENGIADFIEELLDRLYSDRNLKTRKPGDIILSGHSGGYHVMAYILLRGGLNDHIKEVYLFDGLYGQLEKYCYWLDRYKGRFINIYTPNGGTLAESQAMMEDYKYWAKPYLSVNDAELKTNELKEHRVVFIYTEATHNDVIHLRNNFQRFISTSRLKER